MAELFAPGGIRAAVQPVVRASDLEIVGHEALARMTALPQRGPDWWLSKAAESGLRQQLEIACLARAADLGPVPDGQLLFVNLSPSTLGSPGLEAVLDRLPDRLVLELSETEKVTDYEALKFQLSALLERGIRVAIDDTGAGYSSLRHVIELSPDFLKLDRAMVNNLDKDPVRMALVRAMVAFAREVGTHVIAEGIETSDELEAVREAGVHFVQGYLTGRPAFDWAQSASLRKFQKASNFDDDLKDLVQKLSLCQGVEEACVAVVDHLVLRGDLMPSVYLARGDSLRCMAQRGLWQVFDGMSSEAGITGRVWASGVPEFVPDVHAEPQYLDAIPGVVSEVCVPLLEGGRSIGALNVETFTTMPSRIVDTLQSYAAALTSRLEELRYRVRQDSWHAAVRSAMSLGEVAPGPTLIRQSLEQVCEAAGIDSGAIILEDGEEFRIAAIRGPLSQTLARLSRKELTGLSSYVSRIRSCYSAGDPASYCFVGACSLREGGARALILLPMRAQSRRIGTIVLAHSQPLLLNGAKVEPLEVLSTYVAAILAQNDKC